MFDFTKIFGRHEIDEWRDAQTLDAAAVLNQLAADLVVSFEQELAGATWKDGLIAPREFIASRVAPKVRELADPVVGKILERANTDLQRIVAHQAVWNDIARDPTGEDDAGALLRDVAVAATPLAGGIAAAVALPAMAVTTTTAFFGLVTTTAISWPIVVVGGGIAGAGILTGAISTTRIWAKAEQRLRQRIHGHVVAVLIQGPSGQPAILEQLTDLFARTSDEAKRI